MLVKIRWKRVKHFVFLNNPRMAKSEEKIVSDEAERRATAKNRTSSSELPAPEKCRRSTAAGAVAAM